MASAEVTVTIADYGDVKRRLDQFVRLTEAAHYALIAMRPDAPLDEFRAAESRLRSVLTEQGGVG